MRVRTFALGCLAVPALLLLVGLVVLGAAYVMGPVEVSPTTQELYQEIPWATNVAPAVDSTGATTGTTYLAYQPGDPVLEVVLRFEEGHFEIVPGLPGEAIHLEAEYDEGAYRLQPHYREGLPDRDRFELVFERTAHLAGLRRRIHQKADISDNKIRVYLPPNIPMRLDVRVRRGDAEFDFSGLSLVSLRLDTKMGSTLVECDRPNPVEMETCDIRSQMGEMRFRGLGYAAPRVLDFRGRMGDFELDLHGPGRKVTDIRLEILMGELRVEVPRDLTLQIGSQKVLFGDMTTRSGGHRREVESSPARLLRVEAKVRLGSMVIE